MTQGVGTTGAAAGAAPAGYELGRMLNRGGSGSVHEARQVSTGRRVALKLLDVQVAGPEVLRRFDRERLAMGELAGHPNIVSILDAGVHDGRPWLAMDLCPGGSLTDLGRPLRPAEAVSIVYAVASALAVTHARGVLHCDIKPGNILVTAYGRPALSDFGIARLTLESQGSRIGGYTLDHVPPEVLRGEWPTDRGDVWSLGTTVWQLLAGRPPFRDVDDVAAAPVMRRIENDPLPALYRREVPSGLKDLLEHMTTKDPQYRPSADDVVRRAAELARADGHALGTPLPVPGRRPATEPWNGSRPPGSSTPPAPSVPGPPAPRAPHHDDAPTGGIPGVPSRAHHGPPEPTPAAEPRRRRRWGWIAAGLVALVIASMVGGGLLTYRYAPARTVAAPPTTVTVTAAPAPAPSPGAGPSPTPAAPAGAAPLFLSQVEEVNASVSLTKKGFGIDGRFYPQSINVAPPSSSSEPAGIDYLLNRRYSTFSTTFGVADTYSELSSTDETPPSCTLQVMVDDRPLGAARTATRDTPVVLENLDVSGGLRLRLVITQNATTSGSSTSNGASYPCTLGNPTVAG